jgi:cytochrome P450
MTQDTLPQGMALTPLDPTFRDDPYPVLANLRDTAPVHHDVELGRFIYTRHDDVKAILRDPELWSDPRKGNPGTFMREFLGRDLTENEEPSMLLMDEPDHRRLRSLVSASFTPKAVERWRPRTRDIITGLLDRITTPEFDLIADFAGPAPTVVIAEMLGVDAAMHNDFKNWSDTAVQTAFNPFPTDEQAEAGLIAQTALNEFFQAEIIRRESSQGDDLISDMIRAEAEGEKMSRDEMIRQCNLLLIAGNVTTTDLIGNGLKALLDNPSELEKLQQDPSMINKSVEEMLRFDSPVVNSGRIANRTVTLQGCPVNHGESLNPSLAAANRDPAVYPDANTFNISREDTHHQSFGGGRHLCLGAHLARLEAQEAISGIIQRFPNIQHASRGYTHHAIPSFRGMSSFWVATG